MEEIGETIFEDSLYKLSGNKNKGFFGKNNPWKLRYFILKKCGNQPVLECYSKKPKNRTTAPKEKIPLLPGFHLEKVTNTKNRAYVFELTSQDKYLCLSADEQKNMDVFVFLLMSQLKLKEQIKDDFIIVKPENSDVNRRIGAKGTNCILHISPWGVTLALQATRTVLAQWPLKSIRYFEGGKNQFMLEAGRVAPMGDGTYIFHTEDGKENYAYDLLDQRIVDALTKMQPGRRGTTEEMEDYVLESNNLTLLTSVIPCMINHPDHINIMRDNWNIDINGNTIRTRPTVHVRQTSNASETGSDLGTPGTPGPPLPSRRPETPSSRYLASSSPGRQQSSKVPSVVNSSFQKSNSSSSLVSRPPLPTPTSGALSNSQRSRPVPAPLNRSSTADGNYLRMNSLSAVKTIAQNSVPPFSPTGEWSPPPSFQEATNYSLMSPGHVGRDGYLNPRTSVIELQEIALEKFNQNVPDTYLSPTAEYETTFNTSSLPRERGSTSKPSNNNDNHYRLRSLSCEDIKKGQMRQRARTANSRQDAKNNSRETTTAEPFPRIQEFKGSMELLLQDERGYYNIDGLKGTIDSSHAPSVAEVLQKFDETAKPPLTRAISNPNFLQLLNKDKLNDIRVEKARSIHGSNPNLKKSKSLLNLFKRSNKEKSSITKEEGYSSNKAKSLPNSPCNSLQRQYSHPNISINVKGIHVTGRTRSFRKPRQYEKSPQIQRKEGKSPQIQRKDGKSPLPTRKDGKSPKFKRKEDKSPQLHYRHERAASDPQVLEQHSPQPTRRTRHDVTPSVSSSDNEFANGRPVCPSRQASSSSLGHKVHTVC
ncbi:uncharacterized protein LOC143063232 [Mytilus galloprovincialis]|uniref:uncharacterized protein LOC143063232 n=1 Tax=Mytilus galloprovincialis TaxID=29158 RepID=UPI003F7BA699